MKKLPKISQSEWKVMKVLWSKHEPQPAYDIVQELAGAERWQARTVKTLLNRLVRKGALGFKRYKNLYLYYPQIDEAACLEAESESFLRRYFGGALKPMLAHFVETRKLSAAEIRELKKILEETET